MSLSSTNVFSPPTVALAGVGDNVRTLVRRAKRLEGNGNFCLDIQDEAGVTIGFLRPMDRTIVGDTQLIERLTCWRRQASQFFFTQFEATNERTARWLKNYMIDDQRLLFLACDTRRQLVGHLGLRQLQSTTAELDNILRGESDGRRGFTFLASVALLHWLFAPLGLVCVSLRVLADNERAIRLYRSVGFTAAEAIPLQRKTVADEVRYVVDPNGTLPPSGKSALTMTIDRASFFQQFPWLRQQ